jgi:hypothetical protein
MSAGRIECNATILPNGKVLAIGGSAVDETPDSAGKKSDLYDPATNSFDSGGIASYSRLYHSVALLLPDATVASFGSNPGGTGGYEPSVENLHAVISLRRERPADHDRTARDHRRHSRAARLRRSIRGRLHEQLAHQRGGAGAARLVDACQRHGAAARRPVRPSAAARLRRRRHAVARDAAERQPGAARYYMLFLLDADGVPSHAQFIQLSPYATTPPAGTITAPASDQSIASGGSVFFNAAPGAAQYSWVFPGGTPATSSARVAGNVTFSTPGRHVASLTVIDDAGNSDPSPPTRTITVAPPQADFDIEVTPPWWSIAPGQSVPFTVMVTPLSGFTGTVTLAVNVEHGFPTGVSAGAFTPPTITGGVGSSTFTINTTTSARPWAVSLSVKGTSGSLVHAASTSVLINLSRRPA